MVKRYPDSIYKYKCYKYALEIIKDNLIYVPEPSQLNDPFESVIKFDLTDLKNENIKEDYVNHLMEKFNFQIEGKEMDKEVLRTNLLEKIIPNLIDSYDKHREDLYYKDYSNHGILSLTDIHDDIVMWSHYADMHKGVCIKFDTEKLIFSGLFNSGFSVIYDDKYPLLDLVTLISPKTDIEIKLLILLFFNKHVSWKYENEYRIIKIFGHHRNHEEFIKQRKVKINNNSIEEVILGSRFPREKMDEIKSICKEKGIPLYQMKNVTSQYKIEKQLIKE
jgi:hypothetical protein